MDWHQKCHSELRHWPIQWSNQWLSKDDPKRKSNPSHPVTRLHQDFRWDWIFDGLILPFDKVNLHAWHLTLSIFRWLNPTFLDCSVVQPSIPISMAEISIFLFHKWLSPKSTLMFAKPPWNHGFKPPHLTLGKHLKSPQTAIFLHFFLHFHGLKFHHFSTAPAKPLPGHPWVRCLIHTQTSLELVQHAVDALVGHDVGTQIHTVPGAFENAMLKTGQP